MEKFDRRYAILVLVAIILIIISVLIPRHGSTESSILPEDSEKPISVSAEEIRLSQAKMDFLLDNYTEYDEELVKSIQRALKKRGYSISVDGKFGPKTGMAVKRFQRKQKLTIDGIVGPNTLSALGLEDFGVYPRYAPNLREAFDASPAGRAIHLNLGSHLVEAWEKQEDGSWQLVHIALCATGNAKKGLYTDLCSVQLRRTPTPGGRISDSNWRGNYAVPITRGDYFHTVLQHKKNGKWVYDDNSCLGKNVSHGCVRLAVEDAKWLQEFAEKGMAIVVDDRAWDLRPQHP